jgi:hypothetical protein
MEKTTGWITAKVMGAQIDHLGQSWDVYDRITSPGEQGAIFIPTRIVTTKGQVQKKGQYCESIVNACHKPSDCDIGKDDLQKPNECVNGHCLRQMWCPDEEPGKASEVFYVDLDKVQLWFQSYVHFHFFQLDVSTTDEKTAVHYPHKDSNTYPLADLLRMANVDEMEVSENGALIALNAMFNCDLDDEACEMKVETQNIDTKTGYNYVHNHVYFEDGERKRDSYRLYGIRLFTFATGFGKRTSFSQTLLQVSSGIALLVMAEKFADFYLMNWVPERKHYIDQKIKQTEDFNDEP